jgi:leucyl-tRNA synthetase
MAESEATSSNPASSATDTTVANAARPDRYDPQAIELKWSERWANDPDLYRAESATTTAADAKAASAGDPGKLARKKYYVLEMLPYPSGALHMGHVRNYSIGDALARYMWMQGYNVLHPMGWDAFGLPAENAAIKNDTPPREWTRHNISAMKAQMKRLGFAYDWSKELATCKPEYYRWNQWFFLKLFEKGLAYRKKAKVNWCPECATVLANEQVLSNGCCWRHEDTLVEQRELEQWFLRITRYADELLDGLDKMPGWPERVLSQQRHWIGRSEGTLVDFKLDGDVGPAGDRITVFTTRVDTIYGATSLQLAPEHPIVADLVAADPDLRSKVDEMLAEQRRAKEKGDVGAIEKHGIDTGRFAINPYNNEKLPIWVANYVLMDYGTGAIMSVPAHDERDYDFAEKYGLDIRVVIMPRREGDAPNGEPSNPVLPFTETNSLLINSGEFSGLPSEQAIAKMSKHAEDHGFGKATVTYKLRDWGISRQRYWGTPIPMVYCANDGAVPVPEKDLPVLLPDNVKITLAGGSPLALVPEFVNTTCPRCGGPAHRETDTMDTFVDSSWYFYRYTDPSVATAPFDGNAVAYWFEIDQYIGGAEHAILHLIYSRFWTKFMRDLGLVRNSEPTARLFTLGMVIKGGAKMSKSLGNVVSPDEIVSKYGADSARMYTLFAAPADRDLDWQDAGVEGVSRFLARVYRYVMRNAPSIGDEEKGGVILSEGSHASRAEVEGSLSGELTPGARTIQRKLHQTIRKITEDFGGRWHFNTSIAAIMELVNELYAHEESVQRGAEPPAPRALMADVRRKLVLMLAPFAPYLASELWETLGKTSNVLRQPWPKYDPALAKENEVEMAVQVNGKIRARITVPADAEEAQIRDTGLADHKVQASIAGKEIVKVLVVKGRLVNVVVK